MFSHCWSVHAAFSWGLMFNSCLWTSNSSSSLNMYLWCKTIIYPFIRIQKHCGAWRAHSISNSTHHSQNPFVFYLMKNFKHVTVCCSSKCCGFYLSLATEAPTETWRKELDLTSINHDQTLVCSLRRGFMDVYTEGEIQTPEQDRQNSHMIKERYKRRCGDWECPIL